MKRQTSAWRIRTGILVGVIALGAAMAGTSFAWNEGDDGGHGGGHGFNNRTIKGFYGFNSSYGLLVATGPNQPVVPPLPFVGMGRIFFDGEGGCKVSSIGNLNGQSIPTTSSSCVYNVTPDGFGTAEAVFPGTPIADPIPIAFVITEGGNEFRAMQTKFIVGTFTARRQ
jgi:hypothetical protein